MEDQKESVCIICGKSGGDGITIVSEFICEACEAELVQTDVKDAKYPFFVNQMKRIVL